ncbi:hypothetical protein CTheo_5444 [Ceratobasidium theobromae]|uniref:Kinetochore protein Sos7 coiled-coil domain-containing protein n=1 Tax=Ceratobasidium theobromae TaxID=1582974 RepID=A0A5N5QHL5_9AGAM|nr:hypothetical protein CTheo_5444 [Ceratobasidium theobromae]
MWSSSTFLGSRDRVKRRVNSTTMSTALGEDPLLDPTTARNTLALIKELGDRPSHSVELKSAYGSVHGTLGSQLGVDLGNPLAIEEQVQIQKEYVAKLKFRYVEQSAKEDFIKALSSAPEDADMGLLASETAAAKATLREAKVQLDATFAKHRELAEQISQEDARVARETEAAQILAKEIADMQLELARLRRDHPIADRVTQSQAEEILDNQVEQLRDLDQQLQSLSSQHTETRDALTVALTSFDKLRPEAAAKAREAAARAENGGRDMIEAEAQCAWHRSAIQLWRELFNLESVKAVSNNELWLVCWSEGESISLLIRSTADQGY